MAQLTTKEFDELIAILTEHLGMNRFYESLVKANAVVSRKRPANAQVLAAQLYQLSAGLRREHPARYAVEVLWQEMLGKKVSEEQGKTFETLTERVNSCLNPRLEVIPEKAPALVNALGAYYQALAAITTSEVAYTEMLLRATNDVARFLRDHKEEITAATEPAGATSLEAAGGPDSSSESQSER